MAQASSEKRNHETTPRSSVRDALFYVLEGMGNHGAEVVHGDQGAQAEEDEGPKDHADEVENMVRMAR